MFCGFCGKQVEDGKGFCPYCGNAMPGATVVQPVEESVQVPETTQTPVTTQVPAPEKKDVVADASAAVLGFMKGLDKTKKIIIAAVAAVIVIVIAAGIINSDKDVVGTWEYSYGYDWNSYSEEYEKTEDEDNSIYLGRDVYKITFYKDGTYLVEGFYGSKSTGTYEIIHDGDAIKFSYDNDWYEFDKKIGKLYFGDKEHPVCYKKSK